MRYHPEDMIQAVRRLRTPMGARMSEADFRQMQELEEERMMYELALCQRIARGQSTVEDALYVAGFLGLTTQFKQERIAA